MYPDNLRSTKEHEWVLAEGDTATVGITDHAQRELGDIVYVDLPKAGAAFEKGAAFGSVESVKAVSEVFCPVSGEIVEVNAKLEESPELINQSPHDQAWMVKIRLSNPNELKELLSAQAYEEYLQEQAES